MKKYHIICLLVIVCAGLFCGCQSRDEIAWNTGNEVQITEAAEPTTTPVREGEVPEKEEPAVTVTIAPTATATSTVTVAPTATATPTAAVAPTATVAPTVTVAPTAIDIPTVTITPTATPTPAVSLVKYIYDFNDMSCLDKWGNTYHINEDGSLRMQFEEQYHGIKWAFPEDIDMKYCHKIVVKAKCEYASVSIEFFDDEILSEYWADHTYAMYGCQGTGIFEYEIIPDSDAKLAGIGFTAENAVEDFSKYIATIYSVTFYLEEGHTPEPEAKDNAIRYGELVYKFSELEIVSSTAKSYTKNNNGSVDINFGAQGDGEVFFRFPDIIDTRYCRGITLKYKVENVLFENPGGNTFSVDYYDKILARSTIGKAAFSTWDIGASHPEKITITAKELVELYGIGVLGCQLGTGYKITLESITFLMEIEEKAEVPKHLSPSVTEEMTLLNTYGSVFSGVGTALTIEDARHPAVLEQIKKDFNMLAMCYEMKPNFLLGVYNGTNKLISVEEAKQKGYNIPKNYKDTTVPALDFSVLDEMLQICAENNLKFRFHTLIWHIESPIWFFKEGYSENADFVSPEVMDARMEYYIRSVMEHVCESQYGYVVCEWDVVNEYFHADVENWTGVYGEVNLRPDFIKLAYTIADDVLKQYGIRDQVTLLYNDYNTYYIGPGEDTPQSLIDIVNYINSDGKVCDGIGMQGHMDINWIGAEAFKTTMLKFLEAGFDVWVTEMDVSTTNPQDPNEAARQAEYYCQMFRYLLEIKRSNPNLKAIGLWGHSDIFSNLTDKEPLLWNSPGEPKDIYYQVLQTYLDEGYEVK